MCFGMRRTCDKSCSATVNAFKANVRPRAGVPARRAAGELRLLSAVAIVLVVGGDPVSAPNTAVA